MSGSVRVCHPVNHRRALHAASVPPSSSEWLLQGLRHASAIRSLDLSLNPIGERGARALAGYLLSATSDLRVLNVADCALRTLRAP
jgi:hypothetical protein